MIRNVVRSLSRLFAIALSVAVAIGSTSEIAQAAPPTAVAGFSLVPIGTYDGGGYGRSEIVSFDPATDRMFINNGSQNRIDIVSIADPINPTLVSSFDVSPYGSGVNSVAVGDGVVAAAVDVAPVVDSSGRQSPQNGKVVLFTPEGQHVKTVSVGNQPDHLNFTSDKTKIVVAGEGEPICSLDDATTSPANESTDVNLVADPLGTVSIIDVSAGAASATAQVLNFNVFNKNALLGAGVRVFFPGSTAAQDLEPEYIATSPDGTKAWVTLQENNAIAIVDLTNNTVLDVVSLGYKNWGAPGLVLDPSNTDGPSNAGLMNPTTWPNVPLYGMYMPDTIASFTVAGETFLATANEGDARDYTCFKEESRFNDTSGADSFSSFWNGVTDSNLTNNRPDAKLGRLRTTLSFPSAAPLASMYSFGARSFSIWSSAGQLVWDSGSQFEEYIAANYPACFNSDADTGANNSNTAAQMKASVCTSTRLDQRSDDKGVEPEALTTGVIGSKTYAFVGFERIGGVAMYDISTPTAPVFLTYKNPMIDGTTGPGENDISPEGMAFVPASASPNSKPLLLVANELSGTTTIYEIRTPTGLDAPSIPPASSTLAALPIREFSSAATGLLPGATVTASLAGFNPYEPVQLIIESDPVVIGSANAGSNGTVTISGNIPAGASAGDHRLSLYAPVSGIGARMTITVIDTPVDTPAETPATSVPVSTPIVNPGLLPATGAGTDLTPLLAALVSVLGLALVVVRRRPT